MVIASRDFPTVRVNERIVSRPGTGSNNGRAATTTPASPRTRSKKTSTANGMVMLKQHIHHKLLLKKGSKHFREVELKLPLWKMIEIVLKICVTMLKCRHAWISLSTGETADGDSVMTLLGNLDDEKSHSLLTRIFSLTEPSIKLNNAAHKTSPVGMLTVSSMKRLEAGFSYHIQIKNEGASSF